PFADGEPLPPRTNTERTAWTAAGDSLMRGTGQSSLPVWSSSATNLRRLNRKRHVVLATASITPGSQPVPLRVRALLGPLGRPALLRSGLKRARGADQGRAGGQEEAGVVLATPAVTGGARSPTASAPSPRSGRGPRRPASR